MFRVFLVIVFLPSGLLADATAPIEKALKKHANHKSVVVKFRQIKEIPALTNQIKTIGKLWLIPGKAFRWELGDPKKKTIIYNGGDVLVLDEIKMTGERLTKDDKTVKPLFLTLGMGKEASFEGLSKIFEIKNTNQAKGLYVATFSPKPRALKRVIKSLLMQVNLETSFMERIGWVQQDGSETITEFDKPVLNGRIPEAIFIVKEDAYTWKK